MIISPRKLAEMGIVGINSRNRDYVNRYNDRSRYPMVDDKLLTKKMAQEYGIATPELYHVVKAQFQVKALEKALATRKGFVMKPAHGAGGEGIVVVVDRRGDGFRKASGDVIGIEDLEYHASRILSGMFSLGGIPDQAIIEYLVQFNPLFEKVAFQGIPDIRVIVFRGVPVAAMVRLPTRKSDGKANLHQGAIGVGIDLATGVTGLGVMNNLIARVHPDTGEDIGGIQIPEWDKLLNLAARCADMVGLGYIGVDIVLDGQLGPLVLELNARPGLNVQLANGRGLMLNLKKIESMPKVPDSAEARVALSQTLSQITKVA